MKVLYQTPNAGVEFTQLSVQVNEVLKRNASLPADENVLSEAKQQSEDPIYHASSHFSEGMEHSKHFPAVQRYQENWIGITSCVWKPSLVHRNARRACRRLKKSPFTPLKTKVTSSNKTTKFDSLK